MVSMLHSSQLKSQLPAYILLPTVQDVEKYCGAIQNDVSVLGCLRENKAKLSTACSEEVFQRQQVAVDDWRTDKELATACKVSQGAKAKAKVLCARACVCTRRVLPAMAWGLLDAGA